MLSNKKMAFNNTEYFSVYIERHLVQGSSSFKLTVEEHP